MKGFRRCSGESIKNLWKLSIYKNIGTSKLCEKVYVFYEVLPKISSIFSPLLLIQAPFL